MLNDEIMNGETDVLEFKRDMPEDHLKFLKTAVAFANCNGGRIVFGVADDRSIVGVDSLGAFRYMRVIEEWGSGIPRIQKMLSDAGLKPLEITDNGINLQFRIWRPEWPATKNRSENPDFATRSENPDRKTGQKNRTEKPDRKIGQKNRTENFGTIDGTHADETGHYARGIGFRAWSGKKHSQPSFGCIEEGKPHSPCRPGQGRTLGSHRLGKSSTPQPPLKGPTP